MIEEPVEGMLSAHESRLLGCLMEKQMTTPDYYPLTLKALTMACNQKSSRAPVLNLTASEVGGVVNDLRAEGLVTARMDGRADRFEQHLSRKLAISTKERAVLCVLMLRGALTLNEIRINTGRMVSFESADELQALLQSLMARDDALLVRIPRAAGQREDRYAHLLCGRPEIDMIPKGMISKGVGVKGVGVKGVDGATGGSKLETDRLARMEQDIVDLKEEVRQLRELIEQD